MDVRAYVGVGSNIDPERNVPAAIRALQRATRVVAVSTFHRTAPLGHPDDPPFVNGVVALETDLAAPALKRDVLRRIERELGRVRGSDRDAPRTIDLDLLLYGDLVCHSGDLTLPDPQVADRAFVAFPLFEIDPSLVLPDGRTIQCIAERLPHEGMSPLPDLTEALRALVG